MEPGGRVGLPFSPYQGLVLPLNYPGGEDILPEKKVHRVLSGVVKLRDEFRQDDAFSHKPDKKNNALAGRTGLSVYQVCIEIVG